MRILITGANRGLGLEFTRQYLQRGERVIATTRHANRAAALNHLAGEYPGHLTVLPLDAANPASIDELTRELSALGLGIDLLIANAGILISGERMGELSAEDLEQSFRVNAVGPVLLTQALLPLLAQGTQARAVYLSSALGSIGARDSFYNPSYCMSKAALNMGMRVLSFALAEHGITAVSVHPGWVRTDMGGDKAPLMPTAAIGDLIKLIDGLTPAHNGRFFAHDGKELAW
jgi:NAD(P)-dependent dehydrogenase (short-subunit alcohol dehydrogenase family)